jgi:vitamin B12 transporter
MAWRVLPTTLIRASFGQGFKAPTLYQLFSEYGNQALRPEQAHGWDAGVEQRLLSDSLVLTATYFERDTTNQIDFVSCFASSDPRCVGQPFGFYDNLQRTQARGVELGTQWKMGERIELSANYTRTEAENNVNGSANFGLDLPRRSRNTANGNVSYRWPFGTVTGVSVQYVGKSFDDAANRNALDAYTLVDIRASHFVTDQLEVYGRLENALDEEYETIRRYGSLGRGVFAGARVSF